MRKYDRPGFTLPELLVTIAIIIVLCATLISNILAARNYGYRAGCLSNHRQLMLAAREYAQNWNGSLPLPNFDGGGGNGWAYNGAHLTAFDTQNPALPYEKNLESGQLWPYLSTEKTVIVPTTGTLTSITPTAGKAAAVFRCPTDFPPYNLPIDGQSNGGTRRMSSYVMNGAAVSYGAHPTQAYKIYQLRFAGDGIAIWEGDEKPYADGISSSTSIGGFWNDLGNFPWEGVSGRHAIGASVSCYDGHAEWLSFHDFYAMGGYQVGSTWIRPVPLPNRLWCAPLESNGTVNVNGGY